jgi:hypothetical protein
MREKPYNQGQKLGIKKAKKKEIQTNRYEKEKEGSLSMNKCHQIRGIPGERKKQKVSMKRNKQKVPNKDAYGRGNGITHFPSVDMIFISQNIIAYFTSSIFILIPRFSTC